MRSCRQQRCLRTTSRVCLHQGMHVAWGMQANRYARGAGFAHPACRRTGTLRGRRLLHKVQAPSALPLTGLFMNLRVISSASGGRVAENTPTCTDRNGTGQGLPTAGQVPGLSAGRATAAQCLLASRAGCSRRHTGMQQGVGTASTGKHRAPGSWGAAAGRCRRSGP